MIKKLFKRKEVEPELTEMELLKMAIDTVNRLAHILPRKHLIWSDRHG